MGPHARGDRRSLPPEGLKALFPAMLRLYCGTTFQEAAAECGVSVGFIRRRTEEHLRAVSGDPVYRDLASRVLRGALEREAGSGWGGIGTPSLVPMVAAPPLAALVPVGAVP